jgi:PIN domain nuclease of toxin-antitoxin system
MNEAPINHEVARRSRSVRLSHEGPADRFIAATAAVYDLTLLTADVHASAWPRLSYHGGASLTPM